MTSSDDKTVLSNNCSERGFEQLDCRGNAAYSMNIASEESTMNGESQSVKVVAGVIAAPAIVLGAAHSQQIPIPPNDRRTHWSGSGPLPKAWVYVIQREQKAR